MTEGATSVYKGTHKPSISKALFERVQRRRTGKCVKGQMTHDYAYTRMIRYEDAVFMVGAKHKEHVYYEVHNYPRDQIKIFVEGKVKKSLREDFLDDRFSDLFSQLQFSPDFYKTYKSVMDEAIEIESTEVEETKERQVGNIQGEISKVDTRIRNLRKKLLDGVFTDEDFLEIKKELEAEKNELLNEVRQVQEDFDYEDLKNDDAFASCLEDFVNIPKLLASKFSRLDPVSKREALELFFESRKVLGGELNVRLQNFIENILNLNKIVTLEPQKDSPRASKDGVNCQKITCGGESGIRTRGSVATTHAFQACAFDHSAISPSCAPAELRMAGHFAISHFAIL